MALLSENTLWIFLSASKFNEFEEHHVNNIAKGIESLEIHNINPNNIAIFIDGDEQIIRDKLKMTLQKTYSLYSIAPSKELLKLMLNCFYENVVVFVTGHGDLNGIYDYTPNKLLNTLTKGNLNKNLIIYFGQCYSHAFHNTSFKNLNNIAMFGVNTKRSVVCKLPKERFAYTIFLYYLFEWIRNLKNNTLPDNRTVFSSVNYAKEQTQNQIKEIMNHNKQLEQKIITKLQKVKQDSKEYVKLTLDLEEIIKNTNIDNINTWFNAEGLSLAYRLKF